MKFIKTWRYLEKITDGREGKIMNSASFHIPVGQRQLFLDDAGIAVAENLTRTMHQPRKLGAVIRPDCSIGISSHQTRTAPVWDPSEQVFKFLLLGRPDDMTANACIVGYTERDFFVDTQI